MVETAARQFQRLVHLVAWMSQRDNERPVSFAAAARHLDVTVSTVRTDLDTLVRLADEYKDWLASLRVIIVADGFALSSRGSFRRPFRLTHEEALALLLGLCSTRGGKPLAEKLGATLGTGLDAGEVEQTFGVGPNPSVQVEQVLTLSRQSRDTHRKLEIHYCGLAGEPAWRVVHPHQIVHRYGRWYVVAWCESACDFRRFRAERVLEARLLVPDFTPNPSFVPVGRPDELLRSEEAVTATVAASPRISRWFKELYPDGREQPDGRYLVTFRVADPAWLVREVLQYGDEAEVLAPESLRESVKRAVG